MLAIPAVDLRDGRCVQLVGGDYAKEAVRLEDPVEVARRWVALGFARLHLVDLDAATGRGSNAETLREILRDTTVPAQLGGGVRTSEGVQEWLDAGANWVVVGTRGVEDPDWLAEEASLNPGRIILAADVRERKVVTKGWAATSSRDIEELIDELVALPLGGILVTAVHKEGLLQGTDLPLMEAVAERAPWPTIASGGISSLQDLRNLEDRGVAAAVLGMALYTDAIDPRLVAEEFAQ